MKLSIITITRNNLAGLRRTALSIASQTWRDFEWIVIDGASTDGTLAYLSTLRPAPDFCLSEPDGGVYDAMNKGLSHAQGEYLLFMNSGDSLCEADTLGQVFAQFPADADIVYGDALFVYPRKKRLVTHPDHLSLFYFRHGSLCHQATFIRTLLLRESGGYSTDYRIVSDWRQWVVWMLEGRHFIHLPHVVCNYMMDGLSTAQRKRSGEERLLVFKEVLPPGMYDFMGQMEEQYRKKRKKYTCWICLLAGLLVVSLAVLVFQSL